jgi:hypothetical protein
MLTHTTDHTIRICYNLSCFTDFGGCRDCSDNRLHSLMERLIINTTPWWCADPIVPNTTMKSSTSSCLPSLLIAAIPKVVTIAIIGILLKVVRSTPIVMMI